MPFRTQILLTDKSLHGYHLNQISWQYSSQSKCCLYWGQLSPAFGGEGDDLLLSEERFMLSRMDCRSAQGRVMQQVDGHCADPLAEVGNSLLRVIRQPVSPVTGMALGVHSIHH